MGLFVLPKKEKCERDGIQAQVAARPGEATARPGEATACLGKATARPEETMVRPGGAAVFAPNGAE